MEHRFEARAAEVVGVNAAILLHNMAHWCNHNRMNDRNFHDGAYWTYNSNKALREQFPYLGRDAIETAIKKLVDGGYVVIGFYCEDKRDRTRWFSVTELGYALDRNDECGEVADAKVERAERKPRAKRDSDAAEVIRYLNDRAGTSYKETAQGHVRLIRGRLSEGYTVDDFKRVIDNKSDEWCGTDMETYLRPSTLFAPSHFDEYLNNRTKNGARHGEYSTYDFSAQA
jgi:uncharacterized phage protein (TIGR02220 family)